MIKPADCLGYQPAKTSGGSDPTEFGYFGLDLNIVRALRRKNHLGYSSKNGLWESDMSDCGYYAMNRSIVRALKRLSRR